MIETVVVNNNNGSDSLTLTLASPERSQGFALVDMTGLGPGSAKVNTQDWVTIPGSKVTGVNFNKRIITMELRFIPVTNDECIADVRRRSYMYFPLGENVTLGITDVDYSGLKRTYFIDGVISKNEPNIWSAEEGCNIEVICGDPMFRDSETENFSFAAVQPLMRFAWPDKDLEHGFDPSSVETSVGELLDTKETTVAVKSLYTIGATITLTALGEVKNPLVYNKTTNEVFSLNYTMRDGDIVKIDTRPGYKSVQLLQGTGVNLINHVAINSDWVTLKRGNNTIGVRCDFGIDNLAIDFTATPLYIGI